MIAAFVGRLAKRGGLFANFGRAWQGARGVLGLLYLPVHSGRQFVVSHRPVGDSKNDLQ